MLSAFFWSCCLSWFVVCSLPVCFWLTDLNFGAFRLLPILDLLLLEFRVSWLLGFPVCGLFKFVVLSFDFGFGVTVCVFLNSGLPGFFALRFFWEACVLLVGVGLV